MNEITFEEIKVWLDGESPTSCSRCGSAVPKSLQQKHKDWHDNPNRIDR